MNRKNYLTMLYRQLVLSPSQVKGMSFNVDETSSSATVQTAIGMETLVRHYTAQLEKAGWTRTNEGESGPVAWNSWRVEDEEPDLLVLWNAGCRAFDDDVCGDQALQV